MPSKSLARAGAALLVASLLAALAVFVPSPPAAQAGATFEPFTDASVDQPRFLVVGPDGGLWFTATASDRIGTVTVDGLVVTYGHAQVDAPSHITVGPDGALWFVSAGNDRIGRITTAGTITTFAATGLSDLRGITTGPDGNLWFLSDSPPALGRMSPSGTTTSFPSALIDDPSEIVAAPDGHLHWTNSGSDQLGESTTAGDMEFHGPGPNVDDPRGITVGPGGDLWFTSAGNDRIGRYDTGGIITTWEAGFDQPSRIGVGPDGDDLWVTGTSTGTFARVSVGGYVHVEDVVGGGLVGVVGDPAGYVWVAQRDTDAILRFQAESAPAAMGRFVQHADPQGLMDGPYEMAPHSDGEIWFADINGAQVGRIDPDGGDVDVFTDGNVQFPIDVASHPDGKVYFTSSGNDRLGSVTSAGVVTTVVDPQGEVDEPWGIAAGPDGNVWFTSVDNDRIGRLDPDTGDITTFTHPDIDLPQDVMAGPDGNVWFTSQGSGQLGRITPAGAITMFSDPQGEVDQPLGMTLGPDGNIWFADTSGTIGRLVPGTGDITVFEDLQGELQGPLNLTTGSDGRLWIAGNDQIVRMDTSGTAVEYLATYGLTGQPYGITTGPDGNVWYSVANDTLLVSVTPGPRFGDAGFTHPFYDEIDWMGAEGISTGFAGSPLPTYHPSDAVSRQAMSAFMYRLGGSPPFTPPATATFSDVTTTHPFFAEIEWMAAEGITTGFPGSPKPSYQPGAAVSRQAMSAFMYRLADAPVFVPPPTPTFADVTAGHPFFGEIEWMASEGITTGFAGSPKPSYQPATAVSRQAMSAFMYRLNPLVPGPL